MNKGFILEDSKTLQKFSFNEINLKAINSGYLFLIKNENIKIEIQNSVIYGIGQKSK